MRYSILDTGFRNEYEKGIRDLGLSYECVRFEVGGKASGCLRVEVGGKHDRAAYNL
jgi:hypothetical protein